METGNEEKECIFGEVEDDDDIDIDDDDEDEDSLKKKIASHALYGLLVDTHIDCLKIEEKSSKYEPNKAANCQIISSRKSDQLELDNFMEAYCMALSKLKEVMKEPHQETMTFINHMHSQLEELMEAPSMSQSHLAKTT
ncbi:PREDICTED: homeobox protein knotted-1-like 2 isoform X2 [Ipomoea nil]|uniref:homeobox protein knotted-1-like 2 isoform X2 n=1 Tax=Ipomoea nil TaxID=35883 RepID=UPI000902008E|nr:PREDICTED: homeobox protein knotted-1-like 2 isoform X2 [Ipomoea nil]